MAPLRARHGGVNAISERGTAPPLRATPYRCTTVFRTSLYLLCAAAAALQQVRAYHCACSFAAACAPLRMGVNGGNIEKRIVGSGDGVAAAINDAALRAKTTYAGARGASRSRDSTYRAFGA